MTNFLKIFVTLLLLLGILSFPTSTSGERVGSCASGYAGDDLEAFASGANDVVVVQQTDGSLKSTPIHVQVRSKKGFMFKSPQVCLTRSSLPF